MTVIDPGDHRLMALKRAHSNRRDRSDARARLARGELMADDVLADTPESMAGMFVFDFLRCVPGIGASSVREINRRAVASGINLAVTLGELSPARRAWLVEMVGSPKYRRSGPLRKRPQG